MTDFYIYCPKCEVKALVEEVILDDREDSVEFFLRLECGHEYLKSRLRLEKGG